MGKVLTSARIANLPDQYDASQGRRTVGEIRSVEVTDALVDSGATMLSIPARLVCQLGLTRHLAKRARTTAGLR